MSRKKETKCVMCNISYKNWLILVKFGTPFPEQICCKMVETFSTLPEYCLYTTLWNLKCSLRTCYCWLLQNGSMSDEHFKFHKAMLRHYSGDVENVYIILQQIHSGNGVPNFIKIARVLSHKTFWSIFLETLYSYSREYKFLCNTKQNQ